MIIVRFFRNYQTLKANSFKNPFRKTIAMMIPCRESSYSKYSSWDDYGSKKRKFQRWFDFLYRDFYWKIQEIFWGKQ